MDFSNLKRPVHPMPEDVKAALENEGLMDKYEKRPAYQRNDYIAWITRGRREETRRKRLLQMLMELKAGNAYMGMTYKAKV